MSKVSLVGKQLRLNNWMVAFAAILGLVGSSTVHAFISFGDASSVAQSDVDNFLRSGVIGTLHRPHRAATSMGLAGFDVGVQLSFLDLPDEVTNVISTISQGGVSIQDPIPVPKVTLAKGLPFGIDLGVSAIFYPISTGDLFLIGTDLQWQLPLWKSIPLMPSFAVRGSYSFLQIGFATARSQAVDFIISENLKFIEPYVGIGYQMGQGEVTFPGATSLPVGVNLSTSFADPHVMVGMPINFAFFHIVPLYDYSFSGQHNLSLKMSFGL